jgi:AbrB family looped-hinge helix DNA binding protein
MRLHNKVFYGTTTLGEKGQVVIPAEARKKTGLKRGEKLLVFSMHDDMLVFSKLANLERLSSRLEKRLDTLKTVIKKTRKLKK